MSNGLTAYSKLPRGLGLRCPLKQTGHHSASAPLIECGSMDIATADDAFGMGSRSVSFTASEPFRMKARGIGIPSCQPLGIATRGVSIPLQAAALRLHVRHILRMRTEKEMVRTHACPIITAMQDADAVRDRAGMDLP